MEGSENAPNLERNSISGEIDKEPPLNQELTEIGDRFVKSMIDQMPAEIAKVKEDMERAEGDGEDIDELYHGNTAKDEAFEIVFGRIWKDIFPISIDWDAIDEEVKERYPNVAKEVSAKEINSSRSMFAPDSKPKGWYESDERYQDRMFANNLENAKHSVVRPAVLNQKFTAYSKLLPETYQQWLSDSGLQPDDTESWRGADNRKSFLKFIEGLGPGVKGTIFRYADRNLPDNLKS